MRTFLAFTEYLRLWHGDEPVLRDAREMIEDEVSRKLLHAHLLLDLCETAGQHIGIGESKERIAVLSDPAQLRQD